MNGAISSMALMADAGERCADREIELWPQIRIAAEHGSVWPAGGQRGHNKQRAAGARCDPESPAIPLRPAA